MKKIAQLGTSINHEIKDVGIGGMFENLDSG